MKKILITGGTGFIGSHTCTVLQEKGYELIVIDSLVNSSIDVIERIKKLKSNKGSKSLSEIEFIKVDLRDEYNLDKSFREFHYKNYEIEAVIHFAGLKSVNESTKDPMKYWDYNLKGTINLLNTMQKYSCKNLVFSSSATIYGKRNDFDLIKENSEINPINPYGNTKATIEKILYDLSRSEKNDWYIVCLRYFNPIGAHPSGLMGEYPTDKPNNLLPIINKVAAGLNKELKIFGNDWKTHDGTGVRDYIHVMDLAEGHLLALENILNKKSNFIQLNLGTGRGTSVLELVKTFQEVNGVNVPYKFAPRREGDVAYSVADNSLAINYLKWTPKNDLKIMCLDSWRWFQRNPYDFECF